MRRLRRWWLALCRWAHRLTGGYHLSEHQELVHAAECRAEIETADLRLYRHNMEQRYRTRCQDLIELRERR